MFLKSISLTNFRNYTKLNFKFKSPVTVLIGDNAQGKTNFLESIYFLATSKSPKADKDQELIKYGEDFLRVEGKITSEELRKTQNISESDNLEIRTSETPSHSESFRKKENSVQLEIAMQQVENYLTKRVKVNGIPRRVSEYSQNLAVVLFTPEDINMVTGSPSLRRYHIDQTLSQIDKEYKRTLSSYENIITRKNRVLKSIQEGRSKKDQLIYWIDQQVLLGTLLSEKREAYFEYLNTAERAFGNFKFEYLPSKLSAERLKEYEEREIGSANSLIGPHRDDFLFFLKDRDLSKYGSRGEQRTAVLDLKITEAAYIESVLGDRPILLLDDIFSELDLSHRQHVLDLSKLQQTIITAIELETPIKKGLKDATTLYVENGKLLQKADK